MSVIVPTLNRPIQLGQALASIAGQRGIDPGEVEVLVVNDGGASVEAVVGQARGRGARVRSVNHPRRLGLPSARNTGIDHARGRYLAFLDDDDVFLPSHLATALAGLESGADVVSTVCLVADQRIDPAGPVGGVRWEVPFDPVLLEACNLFPVHTAVLRTVTRGPARFDADLPAVEDWDFWLRLTRVHGYRVAQVGVPTVVYHRISQAPSMIGAVADGPAAMARFSALIRSLWSRWPASTPRAQRFRLYSGVMYWQVLGELATGRPIDAHYFLRSVRALADAWADPGAESGLVERLARTVAGGLPAPVLAAVLETVTAFGRWNPPPDALPWVFDYADRTDRYHRSGFFDDADRAALHALLDDIDADDKWGGQACHGDPVPANLLLLSEGGCVLIDWEFTGWFLPGFDLAMLHAVLGASPGAREQIEAAVADTGITQPFLLNQAMVLSRELRLHTELPAGPLRSGRLALLGPQWDALRAQLHTGS